MWDVWWENVCLTNARRCLVCCWFFRLLQSYTVSKNVMSLISWSFADDESIIGSRRRRRRWRLANGIFKSHIHVTAAVAAAAAFTLCSTIMPVGGRVAGKGVGVYNSGGSSDGKRRCRFWFRLPYTIRKASVKRSCFGMWWMAGTGEVILKRNTLSVTTRDMRILLDVTQNV